MIRSRRRCPIVLAALLAALPLTGCRPRAAVTPDAAAPPPVSAAGLLEAHHERLAQLEELRAHGVIEFHWRDDAGDHREQADVDLWIDRPENLALRGSKVGEPLFWLGASAQQYWIFDLLQDQTRLLARPTGYTLELQEGELAISVRPRTLLDLLGLTEWRLPGGDGAPAPPRWNAAQETWDLEVLTATSPLRVGFDRTGRNLVRVELLEPNEAGALAPALISHLDRFERVRRPGQPPLAWPYLPTNIDIIQPAGSTRIKLALSADLRGDLSGENTDRIFDLDTLIRAMQPDEIDRIDPPPPGTTRTPVSG